MRLSAAFEVQDGEPALELVVDVFNVNEGYNSELMKHCDTLWGYSQYVARVRKYAKIMTIEEAVDRAVDECIAEGILREFLLRNKAEVKRMSIYEYDEEQTKRDIQRNSYEEGHKEGLIEGNTEGRSEVNQLIIYLNEAGRSDDILRAAQDAEYQDKLMKEFGIRK